MAARKATPPPVAEKEPQDEPVAAEETQTPTAVGAAYLDALRREREGYLRYDRKDRAAAVAAELKRHGAPLERAVPPPSETA